MTVLLFTLPGVEWLTVKKLTLAVDDNSAGYDACAYPYRTSPTNLTQAQMAGVCSSGSGGATSHSDSTMDNAQVYPNQGPYLWLSIGGPGIPVYGVTIEYRRHI